MGSRNAGTGCSNSRWWFLSGLSSVVMLLWPCKISVAALVICKDVVYLASSWQSCPAAYLLPPLCTSRRGNNPPASLKVA